MKKRCEYNDCGMPAFAVEAVTGTSMSLCRECFTALFGKLIQNAEIVESEEAEND